MLLPHLSSSVYVITPTYIKNLGPSGLPPSGCSQDTDLKEITPAMRNNKKDRKVLANQVICSQYAFQLKHRSMRVSELSLFLSLEKEGTKRNEILNKLKTYIEKVAVHRKIFPCK